MASRPRCRSRRVLPLWFALLLAPHTLTHARPDPTEVQANETPTHEQITVVHCDTTKGRVEMEVHPEWSPYGAARFLHLVKNGFYTDIALFRVNAWIVQFGAVKIPEVGWRSQFNNMPSIKDDPQTDCGGRCKQGRLFDGALSFAGGGKDSRHAQMFFVHNLADQPIGHSLWEVPFGNITKGLDVVRSFYSGYGENVNQVNIFQGGTAWAKEKFPLLDYLHTCTIVDAVAPSRWRPLEHGSEGGVVAERVHKLYHPGQFVVGLIDGLLVGFGLGAYVMYQRLMGYKNERRQL